MCYIRHGKKLLGSTRLGTPNLERAALGTAKTELGTAFQLQPLGTAKKAELGTANIFPAKCAELGTPNLERQNLERQKSRTWNGEHFYNNFTLITVLPHYL